MPANNYGPTTPAPAKTKAAAARARAGGGTSKPVAGPSTKPSSNAVASKKAVSKSTNAIVLDGDESDEVMVVEDAQTKKRRKGSEDEEVVAMPGPAKGAPRKAMSKRSRLSFVKHCDQGRRAKVVMPEKIESAVTKAGARGYESNHDEGVELRYLLQRLSRMRLLLARDTSRS